MHSEEHRHLYRSQNNNYKIDQINQEMKGRGVKTNWETKRQMGEEDNIKTDLKDTGCQDVRVWVPSSTLLDQVS